MVEKDQENSEQQFSIQKVYTKDVSFEAPNSPEVFTKGEWQPEVNVQINTSNQSIGDDTYEVVLTITVVSKHNKKTAFLVELKQAAIFIIRGYSDEDKAGMLGAYCPEALFPFAREAIAGLVSKGGFPQLLLSPVNFNNLYVQHLQQQKADSATQDAAH